MKTSYDSKEKNIATNPGILNFREKKKGMSWYKSKMKATNIKEWKELVHQLTEIDHIQGSEEIKVTNPKCGGLSILFCHRYRTTLSAPRTRVLEENQSTNSC